MHVRCPDPEQDLGKSNTGFYQAITAQRIKTGSLKPETMFIMNEKKYSDKIRIVPVGKVTVYRRTITKPDAGIAFGQTEVGIKFIKN